MHRAGRVKWNSDPKQINKRSHEIRVHSFSTYAKYSEKLTFLPLGMHTHVLNNENFNNQKLVSINKKGSNYSRSLGKLLASFGINKRKCYAT